MTNPKKSILISGIDTQKEEQTDYRGLLDKYFLNKWYLYVICLAVCIGLAQLYLQTVSPQYQIEGKLLIRPPEGMQSDSPDMELNRSIGVSGGSEYVANEIETLTSFWLMNAVVRKLGLQKQYFWKDRLSTIEAYNDFPILVDSFTLRVFNEVSLKVTPIDQFAFRLSTKEKDLGTFGFSEVASTELGDFLFRRNGQVPLNTDSTMQIDLMSTEAVASQYLKNLKVNISDTKVQSSTLLLEIVDAIPQRGVDLLNELVVTYENQKIEANVEQTQSRLAFIDDRLTEVGNELRSMESDLERFKSSNSILSEATTDLDFVLQQVNSSAEEQKELDFQLSMLNSLKGGFDFSSEDFQLIPSNIFMVKGELPTLIKPYNDLVLERNLLLETGQPSNPVIQSANQRLTILRQSIRTAVDNAIAELSNEKTKVENQYQSAMERLQSVPAKERGLSEKVRRQSITENLYLYLLQKREESGLAMASKNLNFQVIDQPHSSLEPVSPKKMVFYLGGAAAGLGLPFMLLLILDLLKDSVTTEKELRQLFPDTRIMGVISHFGGADKQEVLLGARRHITAERFRSLRTSIQFLHKDDYKSLLVTSTTPEEGKTFVASNLAISFALTKKRTIFVDFDLRKPDSIPFFTPKPDKGLINFLSDEAELTEIIHPSSVENLDYINSGRFIVDSAEFIAREKLDQLFAYLKEYYQIVVIDSPPVGLIADALLLHEHVTDSLYVVRSGHTKMSILKDVKDLFEKEKLVRPSLVLNGVRQRDVVYNKHYKKYGYTFK